MTLTMSLQGAGYGAGTVLGSINLELPQTGLFLVAGRNGMGKTTLLRTAMGLMPYVNGHVRVKDQNPYRVELGSLARQGITLMPEDGGVFDELTVEQNLQLTRSREAADTALSILPGWKERMKQSAGTLSGGERKILGLARAVGQTPTVLFVDEPTEGVWHDHVPAVSQQLVALSHRTLLVVVEQNLANFMDVASRVMVVERGAIVLDGDPASVVGDPAIDKLLSL